MRLLQILKPALKTLSSFSIQNLSSNDVGYGIGLAKSPDADTGVYHKVPSTSPRSAKNGDIDDMKMFCCRKMLLFNTPYV